jgi:hypothetical protein
VSQVAKVASLPIHPSLELLEDEVFSKDCSVIFLVDSCGEYGATFLAGRIITKERWAA